jgi:GTP-binding protein HflX
MTEKTPRHYYIPRVEIDLDESRRWRECCLFRQPTKKNFEEIRERVYEVVRQHITRFPQQVLYPDYKDAIEKKKTKTRKK